MNLPRILTSSKYQASIALTALLSVVLYFRLSDNNATREEKEKATVAYIIAVAAAWGISIGATGLEDYGAKRDVPAKPVIQVNTGGSATNTQNPPEGGAGVAVRTDSVNPLPTGSVTMGTILPTGETMTWALPEHRV